MFSHHRYAQPQRPDDCIPQLLFFPRRGRALQKRVAQRVQAGREDRVVLEGGGGLRGQRRGR